MSNTCSECGRNFKGRSDAKTCSDLCRAKRSKRMKEEALMERQIKAEREQSIQKIRTEIERIEKENLSYTQRLEQLLNSKVNQQANIRALEQEIQELWFQISKLTKQLDMKDHDFYNKYINTDSSFKLPEFIYTKYHNLYLRRKAALEKARREKKKVQTTKNFLELTLPQKKERILQIHDQLATIEPELSKLNQSIEFNQQRILRFEKSLCNALLDGIIPQVSGKGKKGKTPLIKDTLKGSELMMMDFETFGLPTELGRFLGQLERYRLAIALTGDSGAGKTYFSFALVELFSKSGFSVKYYSLEMGLGNKVKELVQRYNCHDIALTQSGKLSQVQKDAKIYDVIVVDSFGKLEANSKEFDKLRNAFPHTIFIFIFQKTVAGNIRGGSSIKFDSSMTIDVINRDGERIAIMEKSRYGTIAWEYNITTKTTIEKK